MKIEFSYKWYLQTCKENGLDSNNELAKFHLNKAKEQSRRMKYFMDALEKYKDDEKAAPRIKKQIKYHDNKRVASMLDALKNAEGKWIDD